MVRRVIVVPKIRECIICGEVKKLSDAHRHKNKLLNGRYLICRDCTNRIANLEDYDSCIAVCQLLNVSYVQSLIDEAKDEKKEFGGYLKKIAPSKKYDTFLDSEFENTKVSDDFVVTPKVRDKWGVGYEDEQYYAFESAFKALSNIKVPSTEFEIVRYIQNAKLQVALNDSLKSGEAKDITSLRKAYADDLKDLGLDSVLNSNDKNGENLGQRIKYWENNQPVPEIGKLFDDVQSIKRYISKWFVIPMKRVFGLANEKEVNSLYEDDSE